MPNPDATFGDHIHRRTAELTPAEQPVVRALFAGNPMAEFHTGAGMAARSNVIGPTIVRFASKLGFGYAELP